jgi:hypothetical protein
MNDCADYNKLLESYDEPRLAMIDKSLSQINETYDEDELSQWLSRPSPVKPKPAIYRELDQMDHDFK